MARRPRLFGEQLFHHIYAWGNDRHPIFKSGSHYEKYLEYLTAYADKYEIDVVAYALMESHVHLFLFDTRSKISPFMNVLHGNYAQFYNMTTNRIGHVFGERFNNKIVQPNNYGLWLSRYIHRQAVEAGIVDNPKDYPWTSYQIYIGLSPKGFLKPEIILEQFGQGLGSYKRYEEFVTGEVDDPINWNKTSAVIIGDDEFIANIKKLKCKNKIYERETRDLVNFVSSLLFISPATLLNPRGRNERRERHRAFMILVDDYGYSASQVARAFNVTVKSVIKVLKNKT